MKPKCIGIIGGAGPLAGSLLLERILCLSGTVYGCHKDADFPQVVLISYPFSEMLAPEMDVLQLQKELKDCLSQLRKNGAEILAIACNTLHAFLDENEDLTDLIHLPKVVATAIPSDEIPVVFCTTTSRQFGLHKQFFPCVYPDMDVQIQIDKIIERILKQDETQGIIQDLLEILKNQPANTIVFGCTGLSIFTNKILLRDKLIIDPLEVVANRVLMESFLSEVTI